jgi:hypothetical protein
MEKLSDKFEIITGINYSTQKKEEKVVFSKLNDSWINNRLVVEPVDGKDLIRDYLSSSSLNKKLKTNDIIINTRNNKLALNLSSFEHDVYCDLHYFIIRSKDDNVEFDDYLNLFFTLKHEINDNYGFTNKITKNKLKEINICYFDTDAIYELYSTRLDLINKLNKNIDSEYYM